MFFHGGGWILGDKNVYDRLLEKIEWRAGGCSFVDFERSPEAQYPVAIEQAYAAAKYISETEMILTLILHV